MITYINVLVITNILIYNLKLKIRDACSTADILDCPRHASDDARDMPQKVLGQFDTAHVGRQFDTGQFDTGQFDTGQFDTADNLTPQTI